MPTLNAPFSLQDVENQFGPSENFVALKEMLIDIFGSAGSGGSGNNDDLADFDGYGQPRAENNISGEDECSGGLFRVKFKAEITDMGGLDCTYRFKYDTDPLFQNPKFTSEQTVAGSPPNGSAFVEQWSPFEFSDGDTVYWKVQVYNNFNDDSTSDYFVDNGSESKTVQAQTLATPSLVGETVEDGGFTDIYISFNYSDNEEDFNVQYRVNGGSAQNPSSRLCDKNLNSGTNPKQIKFQTNGFNSTDTVEVRIRATSTDGCVDSPSAWSAWEETTEAPLPSCPL